MHTVETIQKTQESYLAAIRTLAKISPFLEKSGSGYTYFMGETYDAWGNPDPAYADGVFIHKDDLFEYGRPKVVNKNQWIYRSDFFNVRLFRSVPFTVYHQEGARRHEDGSLTPARIVGGESFIKLRWLQRRWGLGAWAKNALEIKSLVEQCQPDVAAKIVAALNTAEEEIERWTKAITCLCDDIE